MTHTHIEILAILRYYFKLCLDASKADGKILQVEENKIKQYLSIQLKSRLNILGVSFETNKSLLF